MAEILNDGGFITGSYDITIDGYSYTLDTVDHDLPVAQQDAWHANGTPKGGVFVKLKQKISVKIKAVTGTPAPSQLVPFALAIHGYASIYWTVTNLKISSANEAAAIRTYTADIVQHVNTPS
jgi:hypothetical protein